MAAWRYSTALRHCIPTSDKAGGWKKTDPLWESRRSDCPSDECPEYCPGGGVVIVPNAVAMRLMPPYNSTGLTRVLFPLLCTWMHFSTSHWVSHEPWGYFKKGLDLLHVWPEESKYDFLRGIDGPRFNPGSPLPSHISYRKGQTELNKKELWKQVPHKTDFLLVVLSFPALHTLSLSIWLGILQYTAMNTNNRHHMCFCSFVFSPCKSFDRAIFGKDICWEKASMPFTTIPGKAAPGARVDMGDFRSQESPVQSRRVQDKSRHL